MFARRRSLGALLGTVALLLGLLPPTARAQATTVFVNSLADPGPGNCTTQCTLRDALAVPGENVVRFNVGGVIRLASQLTITKDVSIQGPGAASLIVDGQHNVRVFVVQGGVEATISGLTIQNGYTPGSDGQGGGILNGGTLTVTDSVITGNTATFEGGGIYTSGNLTVTNSTLSSNNATDNGGAILVDDGTTTITNSTLSGNSSGLGGAIRGYADSSVIVSNSTLNGNSAGGQGGAIFSSQGSATITNSTLSGNSASSSGGAIRGQEATIRLLSSTLTGSSAGSGGGISLFSSGSNPPVALRNTIVANSTSGGNCDGEISSEGNNLSNTGDCFTGGTQGDIANVPVPLGPLAMNSPGKTATHALLPGNPAIDGVTFVSTDCGNGALATDQRGVPRPQVQSGTARCDIGAFELDGNTPPTIGAIGNVTTNEDTPTPAIPFTVGDMQMSTASLDVTATSNDQDLLPNAGIQVLGSGAARAIRLTPATNEFGQATVDVRVSDGALETHRTFTLTVNSVNDPPVAANDSYTVGATQSLTVTPAQGVLANDTDVDTLAASQTATLVSNPTKGVLTLNPNGGFTYVPSKSFSGTDSFTYRASDGTAQSAPATVTLTVKASHCAPRATVKVTTSVVAGKLQAIVEALPLNGQTNNRLISLTFGEIENGTVTINGQGFDTDDTYTLPANTTKVTLLVDRGAMGNSKATTVRFTAQDVCGTWPSLVGGGTAAGF